MNLIAQAWQGGTIVLMRKWDPEVALDLIESERVTTMSGVPAMAWELVSSPTLEGRDLSSLRSLGGGGAAAPPALIQRVEGRPAHQRRRHRVRHDRGLGALRLHRRRRLRRAPHQRGRAHPDL